MSPVDGGSTRSKGRKQRQNGAANAIDEILRRIHATRHITPQDIVQLYRLDKPHCQGCRGNTKDSPNCFCGLVPPPTGVRKQGLWRKTADILEELGPDPSECLRTSQSSPAGLTNLGATCYVNSVLQCLFMNIAFREGLFAAEADLVKHQPVLHQLSRLFAELHSGKKSAVDSAPFANTLELDNAVQQDGQEFLKLLLTLLERVLGLSQDSRARNLVQNVFRGTFSYVTKCCKCGQESDASKDAVDFYELELNVKGFAGLPESLQNYLSEENLRGENQYSCESCKMRVDATHSMKLRSLPPVLNFQLKRFVFNAKTATKKKVTSKFSFPRSLDMGALLSASPSTEDASFPYDLSAILVHKGSMVNSGHYVAHIKDERTGEWWRFDDEQVSSLGSHPLGEVSGAAPNKDLRPGNHVAATSQSDMSMNDNGEEQIEEGLGGERYRTSATSPRPSSRKCSDTLTSADAYMLMYSRRGHSSCTLRGNSCEHLENAQADAAFVRDFSLPEPYRSEVEEMNQNFENKCRRYNQRKEELQVKVAERRAEIRRVLAEAPVRQLGDPSLWISSDWLRSWADSVEPPLAITNAPLLCQHQKVSPSYVHLFKCITQQAWDYLLLKYQGGPVLSGKDHCVECIFADAKVAASADIYRDQRADMQEIVDGVLTGRRELEGTLFFVSKTWLMQWARRKATGAPSEADASPTAALRCVHGGLLPEQAPGAKRQLIPERAWEYFYQNAVQVEGLDPKGHLPFREDYEPCMICQSEFEKVASKREGLRATKMEQRMKYEALYAGRAVVVSPGGTYYLIPTLWLNRWRSYLGASGKNLLDVDEPDGLEGLILSLLCSKHECMLFKPPTLTRSRRGELIQSIGNEDVFTIISKDDWTNLCLQWDVDPQRGITARLDCPSDSNLNQSILTENVKRNVFCDSSSNARHGGLRDMAVGTLDEMDQRQEDVPTLQTEPEICQECIEEREEHELLSKLHYTSGEISVDLVVGKGPPPSLLAASRVLESDRRTSKRARRASATSGGRVLLKVSGETTVFQLKLQIWESLMIVRENQKVHFGRTELLDESATLASLNILPGSQLWVMDSGQHENRDIADELPTDLGRAETEEGFRGTRLLMGLPNTAEPLAGMEQVAAALHRSEISEQKDAPPKSWVPMSFGCPSGGLTNQVHNGDVVMKDQNGLQETVDHNSVDVILDNARDNKGKFSVVNSEGSEDGFKDLGSFNGVAAA
ncbi:unnamed protein product [Calypogeia fissa]